jgi:hypothetical protein
MNTPTTKQIEKFHDNLGMRQLTINHTRLNRKVNKAISRYGFHIEKCKKYKKYKITSHRSMTSWYYADLFHACSVAVHQATRLAIADCLIDVTVDRIYKYFPELFI